MALTKYNLGELLELTTETNSELKYGPDDVKGMTITKEIIPTKANVKDTDLKKFLVVHPKEFIFNPRTHGKKIGFGYNSTGETFLISWNNIAFRIKKIAEKSVLPEYLFLHFNRSEWDREACYRSWGSSTEVFSWYALCEMVLELPPIEIQQKYVDIYNAMVSNQECYERGLEDLKLTCDAYIEDLRRKTSCKPIAEYLLETKQKNENAELLTNRSVSNTKIFIDAKEAVVSGVDTKNYLIVEQNDFAYNTVTTRNADKLSIALNTEGRCLVSPLYTTFRVVKEGLLPEYLCLWFNRSEYDRYARFESWGSARELYSFDTLAETQIPIPDTAIQQSIVNIYKSYSERRTINERLKAQIKDMCPILIKGSIEEARKEA